MKLHPGWVIFLVLAITAMTSQAEIVSGVVNDILEVPCSYTANKYKYPMCWGRGKCSPLGCKDAIIWTDGHKVTWRKSDRYQLLGDIVEGDVSLTITGTTKEDEGTYCCRVKVSGWFNDLKRKIQVNIQEE